MVFFDGLQFSPIVDPVWWQQYVYTVLVSLILIIGRLLVWLSHKCVGFVVFFAILVADHKVELR